MNHEAHEDTKHVLYTKVFVTFVSSWLICFFASTTADARVVRLRIERREVVLNGRASTYYAKQLATHAALDACDDLTLTNDIEVY